MSSVGLDDDGSTGRHRGPELFLAIEVDPEQIEGFFRVGLDGDVQGCCGGLRCLGAFNVRWRGAGEDGGGQGGAQGEEDEAEEEHAVSWCTPIQQIGGSGS